MSLPLSPVPLISAETADLIAALRAASNDNRAIEVLLDQYYTRQDIAELCYSILQEHYDTSRHLMIEPSAGAGAFYKLLPCQNRRGYDIDPRWPGIRTANFLEVRIPSHRRAIIIGNPPFGTISNMAIAFFKHAASHANVVAIALILPRTFRKPWIDKKIDRSFHLIREELLPRDAFLFLGKPYDVPAVFQIWERRDEPRPMVILETSHPDFAFLKNWVGADFALQRVGARAGLIHHNFGLSEKSHYFIRGDVEAIMAQIDFASVVGDVAGKPSLAKNEIVSLYRKFTGR